MMRKNIADISVIVNIYNEESFLRPCVESILSQTIQPLEIILVDDGSSDKSPWICQAYADIYPHICFVSQTNKGLVSARKAGFRKARGKYVSFVDGDDWLEPEWYEKLYSAAYRSEADIVVSGHTIDLPGCARKAKNNIGAGIYSGQMLSSKIYPVMLNTGKFSQFGIYSYLWNKLFKKSVLAPCLMNVNDGIHIGEDACSVYPAMLQAEKVQVLDYYGYHYRQRTNSMVKAGCESERERKQLTILRSYLEGCFLRSDYANILLPQLSKYMLSHIVVRTDGFGVERQGVFPFSTVEKGSKVALYGAGTFGQHIYRRAQDSGMWEIAGWIDPDSEGYRALGLDVLPPDALNRISYDWLVAAFADEDVRREQIRALNLSETQLKKVAPFCMTRRIESQLLERIAERGGKNL